MSPTFRRLNNELLNRAMNIIDLIASRGSRVKNLRIIALFDNSDIEYSWEIKPGVPTVIGEKEH